MKRERIEERKQFTDDEKVFILDKSNGRCCHCGKPLKIGDNFTVEHAIPISKGGTNQPWNIVALCKECNDTKADCVVDVNVYFKYLKAEHLKELDYRQWNYFIGTDWLDIKNLTTEDKKELKVLGDLNGKLGYTRKRNRKGEKIGYAVTVEVKLVLSKAIYSDLDEVYNLFVKYYRKHKVGRRNNEIKTLISDIFNRGAIYVIRNSSQEIIAALPMAFVSDTVEDKNLQCVLKMFLPVYSKIKVEYIMGIHYGIEYIVDCLQNSDIDSLYVPMIIELADNDGLLNNGLLFDKNICWTKDKYTDRIHNIKEMYAVYEPHIKFIANGVKIAHPDESNFEYIFEYYSKRILHTLKIEPRYLLDSDNYR